jgi:hypothetical protein
MDGLGVAPEAKSGEGYQTRINRALREYVIGHDNAR